MKKPRHRPGLVAGIQADQAAAASWLFILPALGFNLADTLGRNTELRGQVVQRRRCLFSQPARLDDAPAARVQTGQGFFRP